MTATESVQARKPRAKCEWKLIDDVLNYRIIDPAHRNKNLTVWCRTEAHAWTLAAATLADEDREQMVK